MTQGREEWLNSRARHIYLAHFRVRFHELDPLGHVNNAVYLSYLEQAAIDHAAAAGWDAATLRNIGGVFIARRHEITYHRPAAENDRLRVITWPIELAGARAIRAYQITRLDAETGFEMTDGLRPIDSLGQFVPGDLIVSARTEWAFVDVLTGRPRRVPADVHDAFLIS